MRRDGAVVCKLGLHLLRACAKSCGRCVIFRIIVDELVPVDRIARCGGDRLSNPVAEALLREIEALGDMIFLLFFLRKWRG